MRELFDLPRMHEKLKHLRISGFVFKTKKGANKSAPLT
jgi:hypothetical protein